MERRTFIAAVLAGLASPAAAQSDFWTALARPDAIALMRHARAPGTGDPQVFRLGDCATQRNLDARGRAQASATGAAFRDNGIAFDTVFTSQWCRCRDTARLLQAGPVSDAPALNSFFGGRGDRSRQTEDALSLLERTNGRRLLVTHQVNITALTGLGVSSGEVFAVRISGGGADVLGRLVLAA